MDKKFYVTPDMEVLDLKLATALLESSGPSSSDPIINDDPEPDPIGGGGVF